MKKNKRMSICCKSCREVLMEELMSKGMLREVIEEKRIVLPYVGVRLGKCESLRYEHGLFVQCSREKILDDNCDWQPPEGKERPENLHIWDEEIQEWI